MKIRILRAPAASRSVLASAVDRFRGVVACHARRTGASWRRRVARVPVVLAFVGAALLTANATANAWELDHFDPKYSDGHCQHYYADGDCYHYVGMYKSEKACTAKFAAIAGYDPNSYIGKQALRIAWYACIPRPPAGDLELWVYAPNCKEGLPWSRCPVYH